MAANDMKKVELEIIALSHSVTQTQNYAVVLGELNGNRRLPIVIGGFEAQAIAVVLERMNPNRPLTHDLFKNAMSAFGVDIKEVVINDLVDGIFFSKLICEKDGEIIEIDSRTSDALAMAVRFNCTVSTFEFVMEQADIGVVVGQFVVLQPAACRLDAGQVEFGGDFGSRLANPHHIAVGPRPERQRQRVNHDRFAGTGLAGERGEARLEVQFQAIDDDKIADGQAAQHGSGGSFVPVQFVAQHREIRVADRVKQAQWFGMGAHRHHVIGGRIKVGLDVKINPAVLSAQQFYPHLGIGRDGNRPV